MRILALLLLLCFAYHACAEQLSFNRSEQNGTLTYQYEWLDVDEKKQEISFNLNAEKLASSPAEQKNYRPLLAMRYVTVELLKVARGYDPREATISVRQQGEKVAISVRSRDEVKLKAVQTHLAQAKEKAFTDYLTEHYYTRYRTSFNEKAIKPDHVRYMKELTDVLIPLSQAFYEKVVVTSDAREYFNLLLGWVQSIPYDALDNRAQSNGSGFAPPAQLLNENRGDCDSKSVLTASIARAFLPDTSMVLILLPDHALLGVALTPRKGEKTLDANGETYVLIEPTGPAKLKIGEVADNTALALAQGKYTLEEIQ